jgi:hypothetical protein
MNWYVLIYDGANPVILILTALMTSYSQTSVPQTDLKFPSIFLIFLIKKKNFQGVINVRLPTDNISENHQPAAND